MNLLRRAGVNPILLAILGAALIAAVIFWFSRSGDDDEALRPAPDEPQTVRLWCETCDWVEIPWDQSRNLDREGDKVKCPKCNRFTAAWSKPEPPQAPENPQNPEVRAVMP
jgi:hypothetical protein